MSIEMEAGHFGSAVEDLINMYDKGAARIEELQDMVVEQAAEVRLLEEEIARLRVRIGRREARAIRLSIWEEAMVADAVLAEDRAPENADIPNDAVLAEAEGLPGQSVGDSPRAVAGSAANAYLMDLYNRVAQRQEVNRVTMVAEQMVPATGMADEGETAVGKAEDMEVQEATVLQPGNRRSESYRQEAPEEDLDESRRWWRATRCLKVRVEPVFNLRCIRGSLNPGEWFEASHIIQFGPGRNILRLANDAGFVPVTDQHGCDFCEVVRAEPWHRGQRLDQEGATWKNGSNEWRHDTASRWERSWPSAEEWGRRSWPNTEEWGRRSWPITEEWGRRSWPNTEEWGRRSWPNTEEWGRAEKFEDVKEEPKFEEIDFNVHFAAEALVPRPTFCKKRA